MNLQLSQVLSDITGTTGLAILRAIIAGERDALKLAQLRDPRCKSPQDNIVKALTGNWRNEHLFVLKQSIELYDFYTQQIARCDTDIQRQFSTMKPRWETNPVLPTKPPVKRRQNNKNSPPANIEAELIRIAGVDLTAVTGISTSLAQTILSEIGTDMSKWPTVKHFASWLGLAPHNDISGGKILRSRTLPTNNRAGQAFRQAASSMARSSTVFGAYYRRKRAKAGPQLAQVATAHKIARTVYHLLKYHTEFVELGAETYEQQYRERELLYLRKKAAKLGFTLTIPDVAHNAT